MDRKAWLLSKFADKAAKITEVAKSFSERKATYQQKIDALKERLLENYKFWASKNTSGSKARLVDIERDTNFIKSIQNKANNLSNIEKERVDLMMKKHSVSIY
jgi:ABC-type transport system involved in cytochrome c biogenesis ATPase subunit